MLAYEQGKIILSVKDNMELQIIKKSILTLNTAMCNTWVAIAKQKLLQGRKVSKHRLSLLGICMSQAWYLSPTRLEGQLGIVEQLSCHKS